MKIVIALAIAACSAAVVGAQVRILQTNSGADNIHVIDPATHTVVGEI
jgi:hypothetical protein